MDPHHNLCAIEMLFLCFPLLHFQFSRCFRILCTQSVQHTLLVKCLHPAWVWHLLLPVWKGGFALYWGHVQVTFGSMITQGRDNWTCLFSSTATISLDLTVPSISTLQQHSVCRKGDHDLTRACLFWISWYTFTNPASYFLTTSTHLPIFNTWPWMNTQHEASLRSCINCSYGLPWFDTDRQPHGFWQIISQNM